MFTCAAQANNDGYALLTNGNELFEVDSFGNVVWHKTYQTGVNNVTGQSGQLYDLIATSDGGFALFGSQYLPNSENTEALLIKTNSNGVVQWTETYGQQFLPSKVIQTSDGGFALVGTWASPPQLSNGDIEAGLVKTNAVGNVQWNFTQGFTTSIGNSTFNTGWLYGSDAVEARDGGFAIACNYDSSGEFISVSFCLVKTEQALPPPTTTSTPIASLSFLQTVKPFYLLLSIIAAIVVAAAAVLVLKKKLKSIGE